MSKLQQSVDFNLATIRRPRDHDNIQLEKRLNGYLPIHIGDLLKDGAYKIPHRLGNGLHANIWLAESLFAKPRYVAIKIFSLHCMLESLRCNPSYPSEVREGLHHIVKTLDQFTISGPTNEHVCHVMELVGPCLYMRVVPLFKPLPRLSLLALAPQIAKALVSLHHLDIIHGDLQQNNIVIRFPFDAETLDVEEVYGKPEAILAADFTFFVAAGFGPCDNAEPDDGEFEKQDTSDDGDQDEDEDEDEDGYESGTEVNRKNIPHYFVLSLDSSKLITAALQICPSFQLIDFTCSFQYTDRCNPEVRIGTPLEYAPPEAHLPDVLRHLFSPASDMWSFGCLLFHLLSGKWLFCTYAMFNQRLPVRYYFDVVRTLGKEDPIPEPFYRALSSRFDGSPGLCRAEEGYYSRDALERLADFYKTGEWPSECQNTVSYCGYLRERLAELREMKGLREEDRWLEQEVDVICNVIEGCVRWDPEKRLTAKQVVDMLEKTGVKG